MIQNNVAAEEKKESVPKLLDNDIICNEILKKSSTS